MSAKKNRVETYLDGFRQSDHAKILACLTDDIEWTVHGHFHLVGKEAYDAEIENDAFVGSPTIVIDRHGRGGECRLCHGSVICAARRWRQHAGRHCGTFRLPRRPDRTP